MDEQPARIVLPQAVGPTADQQRYHRIIEAAESGATDFTGVAMGAEPFRTLPSDRAFLSTGKRTLAQGRQLRSMV
jgi:hypothetical protein